MTMTMIDKDTLVQQLREAGVVRGDLLNLKVSMGSLGYVIGGAKTLVDALLEAVGPEGTIEAQAFVRGYPLPLSDKDAREVSDRWTPSYAGALVNAMLWHPGAVCSTHPIQRFVLIGAQAEALARMHTPESFAYDVLRVMARCEGKTLKIGTDEKVHGVGTTHVAVYLAGLKRLTDVRLGVNYYDGQDGTIKLFERDWPTQCPRMFVKVAALWEQAVLKRSMVGDANVAVYDMEAALSCEVAAMQSDPSIILCDDPACVDCQTAWEFSPRAGEVLKPRARPRAVSFIARSAKRLLR